MNLAQFAQYTFQIAYLYTNQIDVVKGEILRWKGADEKSFFMVKLISKHVPLMFANHIMIGTSKTTKVRQVDKYCFLNLR